MGYILLVDDDQTFLESFEASLRSLGHTCDRATSLNAALAMVANNDYELVFLDLCLPDGNGLDMISTISGAKCGPALLVLTGVNDTDAVDRALKAGAWDYLLKPVQLVQLGPLVERTIQTHRAQERNNCDPGFDSCGIIGESPQIRQSLEQVGLAGKSDGNILITGETGTGKELFAKAVHRNSPRRDGPFIVVDCTNLPPTLAESLLFGHEKGSFTGAQDSKEGLFKQADGGTIFLDEIGDLGYDLQKTLLRVLQEKRFRPLSSKREVSSDFRLIAATNRDLFDMVEKGEFRHDLYYRIKTVHLELTPLRDRKEDIEPIVKEYLKKICNSLSLKRKLPTEAFINALKSYSWPGNVRELINTLYCAVNMAVYENDLEPHHLPIELRSFLAKQRLEGKKDNGGPTLSSAISFYENGRLLEIRDIRKRTIDVMERSYLDSLAEASGRSITRACKISGLSRARLYELLQKHDVKLAGKGAIQPGNS
ncbi:sigma-54-dependent transcriptional regulator [Desulfohalovibrio reitneri]|uniref:sigma-54-dependent transcriptional regulator n=1 Tax=Desulfohalovibrio reitneri TaxID=1307759 RepID=UPI000556981C|nr:sigma-54 dependent transcriptional regulator [Desulfohalovibrio reitneri]